MSKTINFSFLLGDKVKLRKVLPGEYIPSNQSRGEVIEVVIDRCGVTYFVKWDNGPFLSYDADDLEELT